MENLKLVRDSKRLSQNACALALGIPKTTYWSYETGRTEPSLDLLKQMADFFECSVDFLIGHQTKATLYLEGFSEVQRKLVDLIKRLNPEQALIALGYFSDMLKIPYVEVRPTRPF